MLALGFGIMFLVRYVAPQYDKPIMILHARTCLPPSHSDTLEATVDLIVFHTRVCRTHVQSHANATCLDCSDILVT